MKIVRLPLDTQDYAQLKKEREGEPYVKPVLGTASILAFIIALYVFGFSGWEQLDKILIGGFCILFGALSYVGIGLSLKYYAKNRADSQAGEKEVIVGTITQKDYQSRKEAEDIYFFYIDGEKFVVPNQYYRQFEVNDTIALYRAPLSEFVFKVEAYH